MVSAKKDLALIIRGTDWSESSRILTCFTRESGKIRLLAKGGRRIRSNFEVALELLSLCQIVYLPKNEGLSLLTEAKLQLQFAAMRKDLNIYYAGCYIAELLDAGFQDQDPHPVFFEFTLTILDQLNQQSADPIECLGRIELAWLRESGYAPRIDACVVCDCPFSWSDEQQVPYSPLLGGVVCTACEIGSRDGMKIAGKLLTRLVQDDWSRHPGEDESWQDRQQMRRLLSGTIRNILGRDLKMSAYA